VEPGDTGTLLVSQGSVAKRFWCGGIFDNHFIANLLLSVPVKEF